MAISSGLTVEAWSQAALQGFVDTLTPLSVFSTDFGGSIQERGNQVHVPYYTGGGTVTSFAGDYTTNADESISDVAVTIDQHYFVTASLTDIEKKNTIADIEQLGIQMGADLATTVFQNVLALVLAATYTNTATDIAVGSWDADNVVDLKTTCDTAKMPMNGRGLVLSSAYYNALLKDTSIKSALNYGSPDGVQMGMIQNLFGFKVFESNAVPTNSEDLVGFACVPSAIAIAMRYLEPQPGNTYSNAQELSDPDTGMVIGLREWYDNQAGRAYATLECNWGKAAGIAAGLTRVTDGP